MLIWQVVATAAIAVLGGIVAGAHAVVSAVLGGGIGIVGGLVFAWLAARNQARTADGVLFAALKAEGVKILVFIALLALVLATYQNCVVPVLIGAFIASTTIFAFAFFVRDA